MKRTLNGTKWARKDNPWVNQDGPTMRRKKRHWWITRFIGLDVFFDD